MAFTRIQKEYDEFCLQFHDLLEKSDFCIPTFLAFGAVFQLLSLAYLPSRVSALIPLLWLGWRFIRSAFASRKVFVTSFTDVKRELHATQLPDSADGVVVFILGARLNHPFGKLAPGSLPMDTAFKNMWKEAEKNRKKWGYLGRTAAMADTSDGEGSTTIWVTYWRDIAGLHAFAACAAHRVGQDAWLAGKSPYLGVMHELYHSPKGHNEAIYGNFRKWGLGATNFSVVDDKDGDPSDANVLIPNSKGSTMYSRMKGKV